jgi:hypothetical protein
LQKDQTPLEARISLGVFFRYKSGVEETMKKCEYKYCIKNRNFLMDLYIALKTAETVLGMRGAGRELFWAPIS